jgi:hypothetical protein
MMEFSPVIIEQESFPTIHPIASSNALDAAYTWLCKQRAERSHNNSVRDLQFNWDVLKPHRRHHYYESINHQVLLSAIEEYIPCKETLRLIRQYCERVEIMVKTKRQLRKIIQLTHTLLNRLQLKMHPDKTFIGCIKKGFDFLGIHLGESPRISNTSLENHRSRLAQRYAQGASTTCIGTYLKRWTSWSAGVLQCCHIDDLSINPKSTLNRRAGTSGIQEIHHEKIFDICMAH